MPRQTIQVLPTDKIEIDDDWGYPAGINIGDIRITLIGSTVGKLLATLEDLQRELDERDRREAGEAEWCADTGPETAGLDVA